MVCIDAATGFQLTNWEMAVLHGPSAGDPQQAVYTLVLLLISVGLSLLAGYLIKKNQKGTVQDETATQLASRGSYCSWLIGVRRLGYVLTWAGNRGARKEKVAGGKGGVFSGPEQEVFEEDGMHVICVGPVKALYEIEQGGEIIFTGPITQESHPSGTAVDLGGEGLFVIYWGEDDQPVNTFLGAANRMTVSSRWPNVCYIEWRRKRLGTQPLWPLMTYTLRREPTGDHLTETIPWIQPTRTLNGLTYGTFHAVNGATNKITLSKLANPINKGDYSHTIRPLDVMRLTGNALSDRDLTVASIEILPNIVQPIVSRPDYLVVDGYFTVVEFDEDLTGVDTAGELQIYTVGKDEAVNPAHAIADMLFEKWPQGASLPKAQWDMQSLEDLGTLSHAEDLRTSWVASEARTIEERLGAGLQDLGCMLPIDVATGLLKFYPLRTPGTGLKHLSNKMIVDTLPELEKFLGERPVDFMIFGFPDRDLNFRDMTIGRTEDGQISFLEVARARSVALTITTHYPTAAIIADRRTQEEMSQNSVWTVMTNRSTREFLPGDAVTADFTSEVLRVLEVMPIPDSNQVELKVTADTYGLLASTYVDPPPPVAPEIAPAAQDVAFALVEVPEYIVGVPPQTVIIPRIRAHNQVTQAALYLSADDITYAQVTTTAVHNAGGALTTAIGADGFFRPADGSIQFTSFGPDIGSVSDYTGDDTNWLLGKQLAVIVHPDGTEICYLKKVTVVSGTTYSLDGLVRARHGTRRLDHLIGAQLFIVDVNDLTVLQDSLLAPNVTRYAKTQPTGNGTVALSSVFGMRAALYGMGVRPPRVAAVRVTSPYLVNAYAAGDDVTLKWDYATPRTPGTSAGYQDAGSATGTTGPEGSFLVEILNLADTVVAGYSAASATYTYPNASLTSDLGSEVSFKVRVSQLRDGYTSDPVTVTVEKT